MSNPVDQGEEENEMTRRNPGEQRKRGLLVEVEREKTRVKPVYWGLGERVSDPLGRTFTPGLERTSKKKQGSHILAGT